MRNSLVSFGFKMLFLLFTSMAVFASSLGTTVIRGCSSGCVDAVEGDTSFRLTCESYSGDIRWQFQAKSSSLQGEIGTCAGNACQPSHEFTQFYNLQWLSNFSSQLIFNANSTSRLYAGYNYICANVPCCVEITVPAELGAPRVVLSRPSQGDQVRVTGTVNITRVYSSRRQYNCTWIRQQGGQNTEVSSQILFPGANQNKEDRSGSCDFTDNLPPTSGTYTYTVLVFPGATVKTQTATVAAPATPNITCTPSSDYVSEDADLSCTCSGSVGRPEGRLVWVRRNNNNVVTTVKTGSYGQDTLQLTITVNRTHNGNRLRCDVDWLSDTTGTPHTINVAYGPDSVSIPESQVFYTDSTGSHTLNLTCNPRDVSPTTGLTYTWKEPCADVSSNRCSFRPRPPDADSNGDVGARVQCEVRNPLNSNKMEEATFDLQLKYPPRLAPRIQGYTNNDILYKTEALTINCTVGNSDPPVTSVTLSCTGQPQSPSNGQISILRVTSLNDSDDGAVCTCRANWVKADYYTATDSRILTVYYPPSTPDVRRADGRTRPYLEGDSVTLNCSVTSRGHPAANLTWSGHENGVVTVPDAKTSTLRLVAVGKGDNYRNVTCHAVNEFTRWKPLDLKDRLTLEVYYGPDVTLESSAGNTCIMLPDHVTCTVLEGQRVHFRSLADSNPPPQPHVWQAPGGSGLDLAPGSDLNIVSVNRTHSGVYRVQVNTSQPDNTDPRLPLTSNRNVTVLVNYTASDTTADVNRTGNLTIDENSHVIFNCQSRGRPTPELQLTRSNSVLESEPGGQLSLSEVSTWLTHTITAQCNNTGVYTCSAANGVGGSQQDTVQLYVNCKPRRHPNHSADPPLLKYIDGQGFVTFELIAFPVPDMFYFKVNVNNTIKNVTDEITPSATCFPTDTEFNVICNVSVTYVKDETAVELYTFTAANAFGQENFRFTVTVNETTDPGKQRGKELDIAAVAGGIGAAVFVILIVALVVVMVKRRKTVGRKSHRSHTERHNTSNTEEPDMIVNELYGTTPGGARRDTDNEMIVNTLYESSEGIAKGDIRIPAGNAYEDVELNSGKNQVTKPKLKVTGATGASADQEKSPASDQTKDGESALYATVNKSSKSDGLCRAKPKPDVKPKPAKPPKAEKQKGKTAAQKNAKHDEKHRLREGEYSNVALKPLTMTPTHKPEGSVYENFAFEKEDSGERMPHGVDDAPKSNDDGLVYTTIAFSENQLKKAEDPPPERETTEYADIDFMRKAPPKEMH